MKNGLFMFLECGIILSILYLLFALSYVTEDVKYNDDYCTLQSTEILDNYLRDVENLNIEMDSKILNGGMTRMDSIISRLSLQYIELEYSSQKQHYEYVCDNITNSKL